MDGYGNACDADLNTDGVVTFGEAAPLRADLATGTDSGIGSDLDCDGTTNFADLALFGQLLSTPVPGPSGLPCAGTVPRVD